MDPVRPTAVRRLGAGCRLAEAKRELVRRPDPASPFLWASFVVVQRGLR